jgi:hypothetical protein
MRMRRTLPAEVHNLSFKYLARDNQRSGRFRLPDRDGSVICTKSNYRAYIGCGYRRCRISQEDVGVVGL